MLSKHEYGCIIASSYDFQVGTTALVALVWQDRFMVANAGDSRAVLSRGGQAIRISRDHKPFDYDEYERIRNSGGNT